MVTLNKKASSTIHGFTLIELLVVILVISIILSMTLVTYSGINARSRESQANNNAKMVAKKAESWKSALGDTPTYTQLSTSKINVGDSTQTGPAEARLADPSVVIDGSLTDPTNEKLVGYRKCTVGAQIEWYSTISRSIQYINIASATGTPCS